MGNAQVAKGRKKIKRIGKKVGNVVVIMQAISVVFAVAVCVLMYNSLVKSMQKQICVNGTNMLEYELSKAAENDDMNQLLDVLKARMGCEFTIFEGDTRAYSTVMKNGERVVGTKLASNLCDIVLEKGQSYVGEADILGVKYLCSYVPTKGADGKVDGLIFAGISIAEAEQETARIITYAAVVSVIIDVYKRQVSVCGVLLCVIFFICYGTEQEENEAYKQKVIYLCAVIFGAISFLMSNRFYRLFLYVPYLVLLIMISAQDLRMNLLLFTLVTYGRAYYSLRAEYPQNMNTAYLMENSWITKLCDLMGSDIYLASSDRYGVCLWTRFHQSSTVYHMVVATCVFAAMALLLMINHPKYKYSHEIALPGKLILTVCAMCMPVILAAFYIVLL